MLSCWWRFDFFKYLKRWITSRGCWKKWWDNVQGPFCKLHWNHYPPPPLHSTSPYIPTMWPYHYHGYFDLSSYSATTVSNGVILTKLNIQITREQQYIPRKLALGQSAVCKKNNQLLPAKNLDSDSKCLSRKQNVSPHNVFYLKLITPRRHILVWHKLSFCHLPTISSLPLLCFARTGNLKCYLLTFTFFASVMHFNGPLRKHGLSSAGSKGHVCWL